LLLPPIEEPPEEDWLFLVMDRCASNLSPLCFLQYHLGLRVTYFGDPNHDPWNEVKNAGTDLGFADVFKTTMILANTFYGPYDSAGFHQKAIDGMTAYKQRASSSCPLFLQFLPGIAADMGLTHRLHEPGFADEVWTSLGDGTDVLVKGPRFAISRFHTHHDVYKFLRPLRTRRLLMWLYIGLHLGYVMSMKDCFSVEKLKSDPVRPSDSKKGMKESQAESLSKMRGEVKNTIHFCIRVLLNHGWQRKGDIFHVISSPVQVQQGLQAKTNKGPDGALEYSFSLALGKGLQVCGDIMGCLQRPEKLANMGFALSLSEVGGRFVTEDDLQFALEEEVRFMTLAATLAVTLAGRRALAMQQDIMAFPGRACLLLHPDQKIVEEELNYWKDLVSVWEAISRRGEPNIKGIASRSFLNTPCFYNFAEHLSFVGFNKVPEPIMKNLKVGFSCRSTLVIENLIKTVRLVEKRNQDNNTVSLMRRWLTPVQRGVATGVFRYKSINYKRQVLKGAHLKKKAIPRSWFDIPKKKVWNCLKEIMSHSRTTPWASFNAESQKVQYSQLALMRHCEDTGDWLRAHLSWLCLCCPPGTLFRRREEAGPWFFSLSCISAAAVLVVRADVVEQYGKPVYYVLPEKVSRETVSWKVALDLEAYETFPVEWQGQHTWVFHSYL